MTFQYIQTDIQIYKGGLAIQSSTITEVTRAIIDTHCCMYSTIPVVNAWMAYNILLTLLGHRHNDLSVSVVTLPARIIQ